VLELYFEVPVKVNSLQYSERCTCPTGATPRA
jgi:hypothetical protein